MDIGPQATPYSLYDFFNFSGSANSFTPIQGAKYLPECFHHPMPGTGQCFDGSDYPVDPDNDAIESE
jgi:hypothetical protein